MKAAAAGRVNVLKMLIDNGGEVNGTNRRGETALMLAAKGEHIEAVKLLLEKGAQIDLKDNSRHSAFHLAGTSSKGIPVRRLLVQHGALEADRGLMEACKAGDAPKVRTLLARGADLSILDGQGRTALVLATENKRAEVSRILREGRR